MKLSSSTPQLRGRASAAFELLAVITIAGLVSTALIPLLGSSVEIERLQRTLLSSKLETYIFTMETVSLGINPDHLPPVLLINNESEGS